MKQQRWKSGSKAIDPPIQKFLDTISHWIYIDLRNNKIDLSKGGFSFKDRKLSCLCAMPQGKNIQRLQTIFSLLSTKTVRKLQTIFQTLMKTITVLINVNKNCLQDILCVREYVAVSRCFCHGVQEHW